MTTLMEVPGKSNAKTVNASISAICLSTALKISNAAVNIHIKNTIPTKRHALSALAKDSQSAGLVHADSNMESTRQSMTNRAQRKRKGRLWESKMEESSVTAACWMGPNNLATESRKRSRRKV